ncbi:MAG: succinate dehydrogenase assembly factor 2 [Burkholderiaceae bacterium]
MPEPDAATLPHQADAARRRRLRWRARRGLLENDLVLTRFLDRHEDRLTDDEVAGLDRLLDLTDNQLLDLILGRSELEGDEDPRAQHILTLLRSA